MDKIVHLTGEEWKKYACEAHILCFSMDRPSEFDRTNFALMFVRDEIPYSYISCHEMDAETCYIQFGGAFQPEDKKPFAFVAYQKLIEKLAENYKIVTTKIENTNTAMLKPAMRVGFRIVGVEYFKGKLFLNHTLEFGAEHG